MAYVLGYFAADGAMVRNRRGAHFIEFTSTDRCLVTGLKMAVGSNHAISRRERGRNCKTAYRIQIGSRQWFEDLTQLGFSQKKSKTLRLPQIPQECVGDFVRGYFDGDGCVYFKKHWVRTRHEDRWVFTTRFTSGARFFLEELQDLVKKYGVRGGYINVKQRGYDLVFSHNDSLALYRLMYHTAGTSSLYLPRKREKLERAVNILHLDHVRE